MSLGKKKMLSQGTAAVVPDSGYFIPVAYTGTGGVQSISSLTFSPDAVWIKKRSSATSSDHALQDTIRGFGSQGGAIVAYINGQYAESTNADLNYFRSFDSKGFTLGGNTYYNGLNETYVAWCFRGGGSANTFNVDGTGYSTAAAAGLNTGSVTVTAATVNTAAGFSIIQHNSASGWETVPHGLNSTPEFIMSWSRSASDGVYCFHTNFYTGSNIGGVKLFSHDPYSGSTWWRAMNSTTFETGLYNGGQNMISYIFHSVSGVQKLGGYTGNTSSYPRVYTTDDGTSTGANGFRPNFLMIKNTSSAYNWAIYDNGREPITSAGQSREKQLYPNTSQEENGNLGTDPPGRIDFYDDGFQIQAALGNINQNGGTFVYLAIA